MRRVVIVLLTLALFAGCRKEAPKPAQPPFNRGQFVTVAIRTLLSDIDLGQMASKKGRVDDTRTAGAEFAREARAMHASLTALARQRGLPIPTTVEDRKIALKDNLAILPGQVFDRGYCLAMLQDLRWMMRNLDRARETKDAELTAFNRQYRPAMQKREKVFEDLLERMGGSPFGFEP